VIALGHVARRGVEEVEAACGRARTQDPYANVTHPTQPELSSHGGPAKLAPATKAMLANWNMALQQLQPHIAHPDTPRPLELYADTFAQADIPEEDLPPGLPAWMRSPQAWAQRTGATAAEKRATVTVRIPSWSHG
jgi:hypothetical protein